MSLQIEWVPYGRDAAEALRRQLVAIKGDEPLQPVTVVVPSNHVAVATRRLLASGTLGPCCTRGVGLAAVSFMTPYRMAELLGARSLAGAGRRPVSTPVITAALRAALAEQPGLFAPVATHPATETALVAAYRELREVSSKGLDALASTGPRAADVVRLHRAARAKLKSSWYDEQDLMTAAAETLVAHGADWLGVVVVFLPQRLSRHTLLMLSAAAEVTDVTVISGSTGDADADAEVEAGLGRLAPGGSLRPNLEADAGAAADRTKIVVASDADDEVRVAVRAAIDAVRRGTPLDRIAFLYASAEPYARLAHEHLAAAGIETNGSAVVPLAARMAGRVLLDLLALPERGFRRQDVFAWLSSAPLLRDGRWAPTVAWERLSRDAGIVAGRDHWDVRLAGFADERDAQADAAEADPDQLEWKVNRFRNNARRARELRNFVLSLIDDMASAVARSRRWAEHAQWAQRRFDELLGGLRDRESWPDVERKAADRVEAAIRRLAALDGIEGPVGLDVFARTLALELESDIGRVGRMGEGILVGPVSLGIGLDLDLVVVLGLAEGTFPAPVREDSLLPDHERDAAGDELVPRRARVARQHRELLAALAGASRHVLGVPRGDLRRSSERVPSRWVLDIASALAGKRLWADDLGRAQAPWVEHTASFEAGLRRLSFPASDQEHRLRSLMVAAPARAEDLTHADDRALSHGAAVVAARRSTRFTRFDGNLSGLAVPSPAMAATSATRMERWAGCPFAYLIHDVLGVEAVDNPEDRLQISPLDWGSLVHEALEHFVLEVLSGPEAARPGPDEPWSPSDRARLAEIGEQLCDEYEARGLTGRPIFWHRDRARILADLRRFLDADDHTRILRRTRPIAAELAFGLDSSPVEAVPLALADGRWVRFRGKADRIDLADDGTLYVIDYKTGRPDSYLGLSPEDPDLGGRKIQLAVYGAAARAHHRSPDNPVWAEYWFASTKGEFKRIGYSVTNEVLGTVGETLSTIVAGIEAGVFASHPTATSTLPWVECEACEPDGLGVTELRRAWERKRDDPALAPYAQLAEPLAEAEVRTEVEELIGG
jgi:ATP-dependent helicase/nuclease subunit B